MRLFQLTPRQTNVAVLLGCAALGYAFYVRYFMIEVPELAAACQAGLPRTVCTLREIAAGLGERQVFGAVALAAALAHFWRPGFAAFLTGLAAAALGLVLHNAAMSALAVALLILSFARPVRASRSMPAPSAEPQTTAPASSRSPRSAG